MQKKHIIAIAGLFTGAVITKWLRSKYNELSEVIEDYDTLSIEYAGRCYELINSYNALVDSYNESAIKASELIERLKELEDKDSGGECEKDVGDTTDKG